MIYNWQIGQRFIRSRKGGSGWFIIGNLDKGLL